MGIRIRDERFLDIVEADLELTTLETGFQFTEGPAWHPAETHLTFSDIFASTLFRWSEAAGLETFRSPSHQANGNTYDLEGRLVTCEHETSRVTRTERDGSVTVLASHYDGRELNSPNDIVVRGDGTIWFTDPTYGRISPTGDGRTPELDFRGVYRLDPRDGSLTCLARDFEMPNGLAFTPDQTALYVADTPRLHIRRFAIESDGSLSGGDVFAESKGEGRGAPDGLKTDSAGNVFCAGQGGVHVYHPDDGASLGVIETPEFCANFTWGGDDFRTFFLTASTALHKVRVKIPGIPLL